MSSATPADVLARRRQLVLNGDIVLFRDFADPRVPEDVTGEPRAGS
jgi:hypothetical protein